MSDSKKVIADKYEKMCKIGEGSYGVVYKGKAENKSPVALKKVRCDDEDGLGSASLRELVCLSELSHPNIVKLLDVVFVKNKCWLVLELMDDDLHSYLGGVVDVRLYKSYIWQLVDGLAYMHGQGFIHGDLKPQNLLIDVAGNLKIADFGLTRLQSSLHKVNDSQVATLWYRPPEILLGTGHYSTPLDMWSVGCIILEMFYGKAFFQGNSEISQIYEIFQILGTPNDDIWPRCTSLPFYRQNFPKWNRKDFIELVPSLPKEGCELVSQFLTYDPSRRLSARQALSNPWLLTV